MNEKQLTAITEYLKENVWRNSDIMYPYWPPGCKEDPADMVGDLVNIISSLHNLLYEAVTGKRYNYAFHWANKIGSWTEDNIFDELIKENEES